MRTKVAIVYNHPDPGRYGDMGEAKAVLGIMDEVEAVHGALVELGYPVCIVPLNPPIEAAFGILRHLEADVVFNLFEGFDGRPETEYLVAGELSRLGFRYTGCPSSALALALDKARAKGMLVTAGIATPRYQVRQADIFPVFKLLFPCVVKPCREDASHGLSEESLVSDTGALERQVSKVCRLHGGEALVEEFVEGREFNVTVLGNNETQVLQVSEIEFSLPGSLPRLLTFDAKWEPESVYFQNTRAVCPAEITPALRARIGDIARLTFRLLGCRGYARVDMRQDAAGNLQVLEVNPNPDISPGTGAARQALASGMTYAEFIEKIMSLAMETVQI